MAKTQARPKPVKKRSKPQPRPGHGKSPARRSSRNFIWVPWVIALIVGGVVLIAFTATQEDAPRVAETVSNPIVGDDLHSLVVDPIDPDTVYIGSHAGVSVSTDGGATWEVVGSLDGADAMGWGFTDDAILVGGHPGLSISTDGGETFELKNEGLPSTDVHALGASGEVIYAGLAGVGTVASTDGGAWETRSEEFGGSFMGRIQVDPSDPEHLLAPDMQVGAVESTDGGRTWASRGGVEGAMWVSWATDDTDRMVAVANGSAVLSTDGGIAWEPLDVPDGASIVEFSPHDSEVLFAAVHEAPEASVYVSRDGGNTWARP